MNRLFLVLCLLCAPLSSRAQEAAPQVQIVDVLPTVEPISTPLSPILAFDLLVGLTPRPIWWGRHFENVDIRQPYKPVMNVWSKENGRVPASSIAGTLFFGPRWNEALGLYTVHVRVVFTDSRLPRGSSFRCQGELPYPFDELGRGLPFEVVAAVPTKKTPRQVDLIAPAPSLWIKAAHIFRVTRPDVTEGMPDDAYQLDVTLAGRYEVKREITFNGATFMDADGKEVRSSGPIRFGGSGGLDDLTSGLGLGEPEFAGARLRFVSRRVSWGEGLAKAATDISVSQTFIYGGRTPVTLSVPVQRDGKLLEGEISPRDWKIELPAPKPN